MSDSIDIRQLKKAQQQPIEKKGDNRFWAFLNKDIRLSARGLSDKIKEEFYLELGVLLSAGTDIRAALDLIKNEQRKKKYREIFDKIARRIIGGASLSTAMKSNELFTPYEYFSVQIGEETGKLVTVLTELAAFYKKKIDQQRQIIGALTYPVLVLLVAGGAVTFMMAYVVPMFADVLRRFGGDLPLITRVVMRLSFLVRQYSLLFFLILSGIIIFCLSQKKKYWFRKYLTRLILRILVIGNLIRKIYLSRFANTMSLLIASRIPMLQAIDLTSKMVGFYPIECTLPDIASRIMSGEALYKSLSHHYVFPPKMISLLKVGEEVNQLDLFFSKISIQYSGEVEHRTNILGKFLEPVIIVVLGLVVGVILIAMYLPLFKLGQTI